MAHEQGEGGFFEVTMWSTILRARDGDEAIRVANMEKLLTKYRTPIYRHIMASLRGWERTPENAEDLTQGFIAQCLRLDFLRHVAPEKGRFRAFVRECVKNFLRDRHAEASAAKRGGGVQPASLDEVDEEGRPVIEPQAPSLTPEEALDREWALTVLSSAMTALQEEYRAKGKEALFEALKPKLGQGTSSETAADLAQRLGKTPEAVNVDVHRMKKQLAMLVRQEIRPTVDTDEECQEELRYFVELLRGSAGES